MLSVGLTGGIGSGKSEVAHRLARLGAVVVDADELAREAVAPGTSGLAEVAAAFGSAVLRPDGTLDRHRVAELVFADPAARDRLNSIVHPRVAAATAARMAAAPPDAIVVQDVPLLVEAGLAGRYDVVVVVAASEASQLRRLVARRGMTEAEARARIAAQAPLADKLSVADHVIDNDGPLEELDSQVRRLWDALRARAVAG